MSVRRPIRSPSSSEADDSDSVTAVNGPTTQRPFISNRSVSRNRPGFRNRSLSFAPSMDSSSSSSSSSSERSGTGRRYDTDSEDEGNDTTYAGTMIDKPAGVAAAQPPIQVNAYTSVCKAISKVSKSNLPTSLFDTSFQKTQDFLINGPQALSADNRTRTFRVRGGRKKTRRCHQV